MIDKNQKVLKPAMVLTLKGYKFSMFEMLIELILQHFEKSTRNSCIFFA